VQVPENSEVETVVGQLEVIDEDIGQAHSCQVENIMEVPFMV